jgi:hypothetical protein
MLARGKVVGAQLHHVLLLNAFRVEQTQAHKTVTFRTECIVDAASRSAACLIWLLHLWLYMRRSRLDRHCVR